MSADLFVNPFRASETIFGETPEGIELNRYRGIWIHVRICAFVWQAGGSCNHFRQELSNDPDEPSLPSDD